MLNRSVSQLGIIQDGRNSSLAGLRPGVLTTPRTRRTNRPIQISVSPSSSRWTALIAAMARSASPYSAAT
jgi:hypothetical protein